MNSYNKQALDIIAKEQGFIRDNLEKVMRLVEILNYFHDSPLLSKSAVRNFILWLCGRQGVVECFFCKF